MHDRLRTLAGALAIAGAATIATAAGDDAPAVKEDPAIQQVERALKAKDWTGAAGIMRQALARDSGNAEYHNRYAYALRNGPKPDMDLVFKHYREALRIDPKHRGAHEYIGEAYLMTGNLAKAKEHLKVLDDLCLFGCDEYDLLKKRIQEFEKRK